MADELVTATVKIRADIADFSSALRNNTNLSAKEAQRMEVAVKKSFLQAEQAVKAHTKALEDAAKQHKSNNQQIVTSTKLTGEQAAGIKNLASQLADIGKGLAAGTSPFTLLTQQGDQVVSALGMMGSAAVVAVAGIAAVGATVGAGVAIWRSFHEEETIAAEAANAVAAAHNDLLPLLKMERDSLIDLQVATGVLTELQGKLADNTQRVFDVYNQSVAGTNKKLSALKEEQASVFTQMVDAVEDVVPAWTPLGLIVDGLTTSSKELQPEIDGLERSLGDARNQMERTLLATETTIEAEDRAKKAKDALRESSRARTKEMKDEARAAKELAEETARWAHELAVLREGADLANLNDAIIEIGHAEAAGHIDAAAAIELKKKAQEEYYATVAAQIIAERQQRLEMMEAVATAQADLWDQYEKEAKDAADAAASAQKKYENLLVAIGDAALGLVAEFAGGIEDLVTESADKAATAASDAYDELETIRDLIAGLTEDQVDAASLAGKALVDAYKAGEVAADELTDAQKAALQEQLEAEEEAAATKAASHEKAALQAWKTQQAAAFATTGFLTAQAILQSLAGAPFPANLLLAAGSALAAGFQVAAIATAEPPTFSDTPGVMQMSQSGGTVQLAPGDHFAAAKDPQKLQQQIGGGATVVNLKFRHHTLETVYADSRRRPGAIRDGDASRRPSRSNPWRS